MRASKTTLAFLGTGAISLSAIILILIAFKDAFAERSDEARIAAISCAYLAAPYFALGMLAFAFRRAYSASVAVLIGTIGVASIGICFLIDVLFINRTNAMAAVPFLFMPLWQLLGVGLIGLIARSFAQRDRISHQQCAACGYNLRRLRSSRCPECGTLINSS